MSAELIVFEPMFVLTAAPELATAVPRVSVPDM